MPILRRERRRLVDDALFARTADAAIAAHAAVAEAEADRARSVCAALAAGHSTRTLAPLLGVGHNTVARWARNAEAQERPPLSEVT